MEYCYAEPSQFVSPLFLIAPLSITTRLRNCGIDGVVPYTVLGHHLISMYSGDRYTVTTPPPTLQDYIMSTVLPYMEISYLSPNRCGAGQIVCATGSLIKHNIINT